MMFQEPKITVNMISFHSLQEPINSLQVSRHQSPGAVQPQAEEIRPDQVAARLGCSILRQNKFRYDQSCIRVQESFFFALSQGRLFLRLIYLLPRVSRMGNLQTLVLDGCQLTAEVGWHKSTLSSLLPAHCRGN